MLTFELDRKLGGSAYQWTWDGVEHMAAELTHLVANSPDVHHTDEFDKKVYGSTKEEELPPPPPPVIPTTTEKPKKVEISKDRGDQPVIHSTKNYFCFVKIDKKNLFLAPTIRRRSRI